MSQRAALRLPAASMPATLADHRWIPARRRRSRSASEAHAGCLSFEMSSGSNRIVVNCGMPATRRDNWRQRRARHRGAFDRDLQRHLVVPVRRRTADEADAAGAPIVGGPRGRRVATARTRPSGIMLRTSHDGYAEPFGVVHQRVLMLAADGSRIDGEDTVLPPRARHRRSAAAPDDSPCVSTCILRQGQPPERRPRRHAGAAEQRSLDVQRLRGPRRSRGERVSAGTDGPRRTVQIVIYGTRRASATRCNGDSPFADRPRHRRAPAPRAGIAELHAKSRHLLDDTVWNDANWSSLALLKSCSR